MTLAEFIQHYGYFAVAVGTFLEGETVLLLAGAAASRGHLSLPIVIVLATLASFAGDQLFFFLGHHYGSRLLERFPSLAAHAARTRALLARHHAPLILSIRFLYGLRVAGPIAIGMSGVAWPRFLALNLLGAIVWACAVAAVGFGSGHALAGLLRAIGADAAWELAALALAVAAGWLIARQRKARARRDPDAPQRGG